ncbi:MULTISPECIES: hypothetical protein [unclassified Nostoc]|uniref:hypothetical protein n=1 Tax=unclassified Nostoc TaxID=2593658 RepID=UPI001D642A26|nr:hypothetical protein [Nostoc sp. JL23]MBN3879913.1 hypothetical protein [Nostoc sp. JL23]
MSQIKVAQIIEQIKQEITVDSNGQGKASIWATTRLADVQDSSLRRALLSAALEPSALAQSLIQQGFSPAALATWKALEFKASLLLLQTWKIYFDFVN